MHVDDCTFPSHTVALPKQVFAKAQLEHQKRLKQYYNASSVTAASALPPIRDSILAIGGSTSESTYNHTCCYSMIEVIVKKTTLASQPNQKLH